MIISIKRFFGVEVACNWLGGDLTRDRVECRYGLFSGHRYYLQLNWTLNWTELTIACFLDPVLLKSLELVHWATDPHLRSGEWDKSDCNCVSDMCRYTLRCYCLGIWVWLWTDLVFAAVLVCFLDIHGGLEEEVKCQSTWQPHGPDCGAAGQPVKLSLPYRMQKLQQVWCFFCLFFFFSLPF